MTIHQQLQPFNMQLLKRHSNTVSRRQPSHNASFNRKTVQSIKIHYHNLSMNKSYIFNNENINHSDVLYVTRNIKNSSDLHFLRLASHISVLKNIINMDENKNNYYFINENCEFLPEMIQPILYLHNIDMLIMNQTGKVYGNKIDSQYNLFKLKSCVKNGFNIGYSQYIIKCGFIPYLIKTLLPINPYIFNHNNHFDIILRRSNLINKVHSFEKPWNKFSKEVVKFTNIELDRRLKFNSSINNMKIQRFNLKSDPIDAVVLWVDPTDTNWQKSYFKYSNKPNIDKKRFSDNGELRYCLRGLYHNTPWLRNIYLVTCGHKPRWLNLEKNNKIKLISHEEIFPKGTLPCFNSSVIEMFIHKIPGLSDYFIYSNDDTLITRYTPKNYFFDNQGRPYFNEHKDKFLHLREGYYDLKDCTQTTFHNAMILINSITKQNNIYKRPAHQVCIVYKPIMKELCENILAEELSYNKFRSAYFTRDDKCACFHLILTKILMISVPRRKISEIQINGIYQNIYAELKHHIFACLNAGISRNMTRDLNKIFNKKIPGEL